MTRKANTRIRSKDHQGGVELLLAEDVPSLGEQGDIVRVKRGYARNYLVPQGLATVATDANRRMVEVHRSRQQEQAKLRLSQIKKLADDVAKYSVTIDANATDEGHLYGSVVASDISKSLVAAGYPVEPEAVILEGPLKELGMYTVKLQLHPEVETEVKVWVVPSASISS
ncbi:MAG: 50S ribosomal protein L9 [Planctomycetota bacterium]|nr:MAG: 50S ribosomal protein L9 [Planctomycetota bacterium]REJ94997.1 MAG: 50S ribosomal protein L9 [Planctomycetota bacterium]REK23434.1 MAG: 50S ribosomal protein L9 [Planctomycetota bacterium]REK38926.1 MAG: 50S ribosomal protein L9 [Planctomycetota bacterium]